MPDAYIMTGDTISFQWRRAKSNSIKGMPLNGHGNGLVLSQWQQGYICTVSKLPLANRGSFRMAIGIEWISTRSFDGIPVSTSQADLQTVSNDGCEQTQSYLEGRGNLPVA